MEDTELCPCHSGKTFGECCGPILADIKKAESAEALMRARYSAYATGDVKFLYLSSGPKVREEFDDKTTAEWSKNAKWDGLDIVATENGATKKDGNGTVEFVAHYSAQGQNCNHHERSEFQVIDGEWRFIDGEIINDNKPIRREAPKVGRNDPCPCGSGKKYKKCCGKNVK